MVEERTIYLMGAVLKAGFLDIEKLDKILEIAEKLDICNYEIVEYAEELGSTRININTILYSAMKLIIDRIAENCNDEIKEKLEDYPITINYFDSWFNIEALDELMQYSVINLSKNEIIQRVKQELIKIFSA